MDLEAVEALFPKNPVLFHPIGDVLERVGLELAMTPLRIAALGDQPGFFQHFHVLRDRRQLIPFRNGLASSETLASPRDSRASIALRVGSASAANF